MSILIFCDTSADVDAAIDEHGAGHTIVPVKPGAAWRCQQRDLRYRTLDSFDHGQRTAVQGPAVRAATTDWLRWVDSHLQAQIDGFGAERFVPASLYLLNLSTFLGELIIGRSIIQTVLDEVRPDLVSVPDGPLTPPGTWSRIVPRSFSESDYAGEVAAARGCEVRRVARAAGPLPAAPRRAPVVRRFADQLPPGTWVNLVTARRYGVSSVLKSSLGGLRARARVLCLGYGYDLDPIRLALGHCGARVDQVPDPTVFSALNTTTATALSRQLQTALDAAWATPRFLAPFHEVAKSSVFRYALERWWLEVVPHLWGAYLHAKQLFLGTRYDAVINWAVGEGVMGAVLAGARASDVPSFTIMHGGTSRMCYDHLALSDAAFSDHYLVQAPGKKRLIDASLLRLDVQPPARTAVVGSGLYDRLREASWIRRARQRFDKRFGMKRRPVLLFVPTVYSYPRIEDSWLVGCDYFEFLQQVLRVFAERDTVDVLFKAFPGTLDNVVEDPIPEFIRSEGLANISVVDDMPVTELMWSADGIALDHNQTALGEVLLTDAPLIVLDQGDQDLRVTEAQSVELLRRRAVVATGPDEFVSKLRGFLATFDSMRAGPETTFLREYGTDALDGRAGWRGAEYVMAHRRAR